MIPRARSRGTIGSVGRTVLVALLLLTACSSAGSERTSGPDRGTRLEIQTDDGVVGVDVEIADDDDERTVGLMNRERLDPDAGMVFLWEEPLHATFWMKDTLIPLSIAFWNERDMIVAILDMEPCEADPCPSYDPGTEFEGALEVNQGFFDDHGVEVGDRVELVEAAP
jgi:uncharacterized membrane protein (UPF0127 family)